MIVVLKNVYAENSKEIAIQIYVNVVVLETRTWYKKKDSLIFLYVKTQ